MRFATHIFPKEFRPTLLALLSRALRNAFLAFLVATILPVAILRWVPPPTSAFMVRARIAAISDGPRDFRLYYQWVPWGEIAPAAKLAAVAAEDQLFSEHLGFDFAAMEKAWLRNQQGRRIRGASTISQQVAKNLFLYPSRSFFRKTLEAYFTTLIELLWSKQRILEVYLNIAQFGDRIYGVSEASRIFFGKPASQLGAPDAALLAAVLPNPVLLRAEKPSAYLLRRRLWILRQMRQLGGTQYLRELR